MVASLTARTQARSRQEETNCLCQISCKSLQSRHDEGVFCIVCGPREVLGTYVNRLAHDYLRIKAASAAMYDHSKSIFEARSHSASIIVIHQQSAGMEEVFLKCIQWPFHHPVTWLKQARHQHHGQHHGLSTLPRLKLVTCYCEFCVRNLLAVDMIPDSSWYSMQHLSKENFGLKCLPLHMCCSSDRLPRT